MHIEERTQQSIPILQIRQLTLVSAGTDSVAVARWRAEHEYSEQCLSKQSLFVQSLANEPWCREAAYISREFPSWHKYNEATTLLDPLPERSSMSICSHDGCDDCELCAAHVVMDATHPSSSASSPAIAVSALSGVGCSTSLSYQFPSLTSMRSQPGVSPFVCFDRLFGPTLIY